MCNFYILLSKKMKEPHISTTNKILVLLSGTHNVLAVMVISCILLFSIDLDIPMIDFCAFLVPTSFILFKRCIYSDIHEHIRLGQEVPEYTDDVFFFKILQRFFFNKEFVAKSDLKEYKKGKVMDVEHFSSLSDPEIISDIFNEKAQYIAINCILAVILLTKYKLKKAIPLYLIWFYYNFTN